MSRIPPVTRRAARIAQVVVAAAVAGAALAGCTVTVEGVPQAQPRAAAPAPPAPTTVAPVPARPNQPALSGLEEQAAVYAEWVADGWMPEPLLPVTDPYSGVSASLFGTAQRTEAVDGGVAFESLDAPASVVNWFAVFPVPDGYFADAGKAAEGTAASKNGRVVSSRPVTVAGYSGLDVRIEFTTDQGRPVVDLIRFVELPTNLVAVESAGLASDERVLEQVQQIMVDGLEFPTV